MPMRILIGLLLALALAMEVRTRLAAVQAKRLERQREQLLEDVGLLQTALLPVLPGRLGPLATSAAYRPAAGPGAGGDFYDVFALEDGRVAVILGDVSGHGREALPHTALLRFTLRAYLEAGLSPRGAVQTAGDVLARQLGGSFATVVVATYQPSERTLVYSCAGHPPPVVLGEGTSPVAAVSVTAGSAPPLGVGVLTGTRQTVLSLPGHAVLCFHTDGVTEARVGAELFGEERLAQTLAELGSAASASSLLDRVAERTDRRPDDMAACVLSLEGGADAPRILVEELELDRAEEAGGERAERFLLACGVPAGGVPEIVREARAGAELAGSIVLRLRLGDGPPQVTLQPDNLTHIRARRLSQPAVVGASL
jgi:Stage II sporulation protein E (SpoIIE)